jgi:hypothetical protein
MANTERQMPEYRSSLHGCSGQPNLSEETAVGGDHYALLVYAAIFVVSAQYFQRTDFARNCLALSQSSLSLSTGTGHSASLCLRRYSPVPMR